MIDSLVKRLRIDYPDIRFVASDDFRWSPSDKSVHYRADTDDVTSLLHETAHALLGHTDFVYDIDLLKIERQAWSYARETLSPRYGVDIDESDVETALDSYRDWLHGRSLCPNCSQNGIQNTDRSYHCISCGEQWRANDARRCALRRYRSKK